MFPNQTVIFTLLFIGFFVGTISGMVGLGGGILVIPILMLGFGFSQAKANGTSLAMLLPPIGIFAVMGYWRTKNVDLSFAALLAIGFALGAFVGAKVVNSGWIHPTGLRIAFSILLLYTAGGILFRSGGKARAALETALMIVVFVGTYAVMRLFGRRLHRLPNWPAEYRRRLQVPSNCDYEI